MMERARIEKISKALADSTRLMIFEAISGKKEVICGDLVAMRGVTPATVSHHLKILADAGLIECRRQGQFVYNRAIPQTIKEYSHALARLASGLKKQTRKP
jgi:ArsR family transcriptional regulator